MLRHVCHCNKKTGETRVMDELLIYRGIVHEIQATLCNQSMEAGGILGMTKGVVSAYYWDSSSETSYGFYQPNTAACEEVINNLWASNGIEFCGCIHTHRVGMYPSSADIQYFQQIYDSIKCIREEPDIVLAIARQSPESSDTIYAFCGRYDKQNRFTISPVLVRII